MIQTGQSDMKQIHSHKNELCVCVELKGQSIHNNVIHSFFVFFSSYLFSVLSIRGYNGQVLLRNELSKHSL